MIKCLVLKLSRIPFVQNAIAEEADLSAFKKKPTPRIIIGMVVIALSYLLGWPLIGVLGVLSIYLSRPWLLVVGGPVVYIISHLVFWLGMYLAGMRYSWIFIRWLTRIIMLKLMKKCQVPVPHYPQEN